MEGKRSASTVRVVLLALLALGLLVVVPTPRAYAAGIVYNTVDNFDRADSTTLGTTSSGNATWTENEAAAGQLSIAGNVLRAETAGLSGLEPTNASIDLTGEEASFDLGATTTGWAFHFDLNRNPSGWGSANYGLGWVLAGNESDFSSATVDGYAVLWTATDDELRLVRFNDGISGLDPGTAVVSTGVDWDTVDAAGMNVRVEVDASGTWTLYWEAGEPLATATDIDANSAGGSDATLFSDANLKYAGPIWAHSTGTAGPDSGDFDNFAFGIADTPPTVSSTDPASDATGVAVNANITITFIEDVTVSGAWYSLSCSSGARTATVTGTSPTTTYTLDPDSDFARGDRCTVTIDKDLVADVDGTADNMAADYSWSFTVLADVVVGEILQNPSGTETDREWFELYNAGPVSVDINGWNISDLGSDSHTINNGGALNIGPGAYLVLCRNSDSGLNGGVTCDYRYSGITLANGSDEVILKNGAGTEVDRVVYDGGTTFPNPGDGVSMCLIDPDLDNNSGGNWLTSQQSFGGGDKGTPGTANRCPEYRSGAVGNWSATSTWQVDDDGDGVYDDVVPQAPGPFHFVTVRNGHTVTVDGEVTVAAITIDSGGQLTVGSGASITLAGAFTNNGTLANNGTINQSQAAALGALSFGMAGVDMFVDSTDAGTISVSRIAGNHPNATPGIQGSAPAPEYFQFSHSGSSYQIDLTFANHTGSTAGLRSCRYDSTAGTWDCQPDDNPGDTSSITRNNVTAFSGWQGCSACGPTALRSRGLAAHGGSGWPGAWLLPAGFLALGTWLIWRRRQAWARVPHS